MKPNTQKYNKTTNIIFPILGIIIMFSFLAAVWFWESYGQDIILKTDVVVAKVDIKEGSILTPDMLDLRKFEKDNVAKGTISKMDEIVGMAAKVNLSKNMLLNSNLVDDPQIVLKEDQYIIKIPSDWIAAVPSSLRRKDTVYLYSIKDQLLQKSSTEQKINSLNTYSSQSSYNINSNPVLKADVAFVKDSSNREIVTISNEERYDANATIGEVELILKLDELKKLEEEIARGYKLLLMYQ